MNSSTRTKLAIGTSATARALLLTGCVSTAPSAGTTTSGSSPSVATTTPTATAAPSTAASSPTPRTPSPAATPSTIAPAVPAVPAPTAAAPAPPTAAPKKQILSPQPLGPQASAEDLEEAREELLEYGYSAEEAAAWPTLAVVLPEQAIDVIAGIWGRGSNLTYDAVLDRDSLVFLVSVIVRSPYDDGEPPLAVVWEVRSDGNYSRVS